MCDALVVPGDATQLPHISQSVIRAGEALAGPMACEEQVQHGKPGNSLRLVLILLLLVVVVMLLVLLLLLATLVVVAARVLGMWLS